LLEGTRKRRRQWGIASAALAAVLCVVSVLLWQVRHAEQRARNDAEIAAAVNQFLTQDLLGQANPLVSGRNDVRVRDLLDAAAKNVGTRFTGRPVAEASVRAALGNAYLGLGQFTPAQAELESALRLAEASGEADTIAINARVDLGALHTRRSEYAKARDVLAPLLAHADPAVRVRGEIATAFALMAEGDFKSALARLREVRPRVETLLGPTSTEALTTLSYLASAHRQLGQYKEAIVLYRQALAGQEAQHGKGHVATLEAMRSLGGALYLSGALAEALPVLESASKLSVELNGPRHDRTLNSLSDLALVKQDLKDYPGAEALMLSTLEVRGAEYGKDSADYRTLLNNLGVLYGEMGDPVRQHQYLAQGCAAEKAASGPSSPDTLICHHNLALALMDLKRYAEAAALEQETMALGEPVFGAEHMFMGATRSAYAVALGYLGRTQESEKLFAEGVALLDKALGPGNDRTAKAIQRRDAMRAAMATAPATP
jgi:tetratricopeptide (TPR) repeat protein